MKIWIVSHYAIPPAQAGSTRHHSLARYLIQRGHEVTIISGNFCHMVHEKTVSMSDPQLKEFGGVPFALIPTPPYSNNLKRVWNMVIFMLRVWVGQAEKILSSNPDVIFASTPDHFAGFAALRLARRHHAPFVFEVRDPWPLTLVEIGKIPRYHPFVILFGWLERYLYRNADWIVSLLPTIMDNIVQRGGHSDRISWIPNGVDLSHFPDPQPPAQRNGFTIMYAGLHSLANDPDCILDAAKLLAAEGHHSIKFRMVGSGVEKPRLIRRATDEGLTNISFEPPVAKSEIGTILSEADAFVTCAKDVPIRRTLGVSPNKAFDYLAAARPVIWAIESTNNIVEEAQAGISVRAEDPQALAEAIKQIANMPLTERWNMGLRGRQYVSEHYDYEKLAQRLESILLTVVKSS